MLRRVISNFRMELYLCTVVSGSAGGIQNAKAQRTHVELYTLAWIAPFQSFFFFAVLIVKASRA
jgi:hypothetical protein